MICVVQRVAKASVTVEEHAYRTEIGPGLCVLLCTEAGDEESDAVWMAAKLAKLRIFRDDQDKMNRSVQDIAGQMLIVSQFTLAADVSHGNRPSFVNAANPELGKKLYERVCHLVASEHRVPVQTGIFGARMQLHIENDGPVTLIVKSR